MEKSDGRKSHIFSYIFYILVLIILSGILYVQHSMTPFEASAIEKVAEIISPVKNSKAELAASNVWYPKVGVKGVQSNVELSAEAAFFVDTQSGEVLFEKNADQRLPIASLTKIMTAIVALEHKKMSDIYQISQRAADMEPDKMLLIAGERLTLEELLSGIFLVSANDASEAIAEGTLWNREDFIAEMNRKALELGMQNTRFINPSGLDEDGVEQYSTAMEVALMSRYAISRFPELVDISSKPHIYLPVTENHQDYDMYSGINLLTTYPGVLGFKTGFTYEAGYTLVTLARKDGHEVLGVLLNAPNRREDAKILLDYSFAKLAES